MLAYAPVLSSIIILTAAFVVNFLSPTDWNQPFSRGKIMASRLKLVMLCCGVLEAMLEPRLNGLTDGNEGVAQWSSARLLSPLFA
jgi:hypothetical protein